MSQPVFVIALLGMSPAVVTELLWHLVKVEERRVVGLEIWTTSSAIRPAGSRMLNTLAALDRTLREQLGSLAEHLPPLPANLEPAVSRPELPGPVARVVRFCDADDVGLTDVDDDASATRVAEQLERRVGELTRSLGEVELVGSLAGGRKTMSAALQTAFALHARPLDRLLHVLLHPDLESKGPPLLSSFACPVAAIDGIAPADQLSVHEVAFPWLQWLCPDLADRLAHMPYERLCRMLRAGEATDASLAPRGETSGLLTVTRDGVELARVLPNQ